MLLLCLGVSAITNSGCISIGALQQAKEADIEAQEKQHPVSYPLNAEDIRNLDSLVNKVLDPSNPISVCITNSMYRFRLDELIQYRRGKIDADRAREVLVEALHGFVEQGDWSAATLAAFDHVAFRSETERLRRTEPADLGEKRRLHRMMLEDAYPGELREIPPASTIVVRRPESANYIVLIGTVPLDIATLPIQAAWFGLIYIALRTGGRMG